MRREVYRGRYTDDLLAFGGIARVSFLKKTCPSAIVRPPPFSDTYVSPALCEDSCLWPFAHLQQLPSKSFSRRAPPARRTRLMNKWVLFIRCPFVISFFYREPAPEILFEVAERHYVSIFSRFCIRRDSAILMAVDCHFEFFHIFKWRSSAKSHKSVIIKLR